QQLLFSRQFRLTLGSNLANENILWPNFRTNIDDAALIQVAQTLFTHVRNVTRDLFRTELGIASLNLVLLNMDRGKVVFLHDTLTDQDSIFVVATFPAHEGHQNVLPKGQFAVLRRGAIGNHLTGIHIVALTHNRSLIDTGTGVRAHKFTQAIAMHFAVFVHNINFTSGRSHHFTIHVADHHLTRIDRHLPFDPGATHG